MVFGLFKRGTVTEAYVAGDESDQEHSGSATPNSDAKYPDEKGIKVVPAPAHEILDDDAAAQRLKLFKKTAQHDPNLPLEDLDMIDNAVGAHDVNKENDLLQELVEDSPYPEVRASVRNYDIDVPANTIRAWTLGLLMTTVFSALNCLFSLRDPSITITSIVAQLIAYPLGVAWAKVFPDREWNVLGVKFNLNPGPWNIKEHAMVVIMANASYGGGTGYFTYVLTAQHHWYQVNWGWGYAILLGLTTQCVGFGLAGLARKWVVDPPGMIWPVNLVSTSFMYTLHDHAKTDPTTSNGWSISRYRYFLYVFAGSFLWYWIPGVIFPAISTFTFITLIAPNNVVVNKVFGGNSGMGLIPLTFDWTQISGFLTSPLIAPFHALANTAIGVVFFFWIVAPALHFSGVWYADYMPFLSSGSYDNTQAAYNVTRILTPEYTLDVEKYEAYSPLYLSTTFALCYGLSFAGIISLVTHTALNHGQEIVARFRDKDGRLDDIHTKMMKKYKPVPAWWFGTVFVVFAALAFVTSYVWPTGLTWWALIIALLISIVWIIPVAMVQAVTNIQIGLNVFTEFLVGYILPGRPNAMMMFKTYGYISMTQGLAFIEDMKLGHYLKLPPRTMFFGQLTAAAWGVLVQVATFYWAMGAFPNICTDEAPNNFSCPSGEVFFTASVIWGLIGPQRMFSGTGLYKNLQYFWIAGAVAPAIMWLIVKKWPRSIFRYANVPVILNGNANIPPATLVNYMSWFAVGAFFNKYIRGKYLGWWERFNYVTSAGLDSGLALSTILVVLTLSLTNSAFPDWWGTTAFDGTLDYLGTAIKIILPEGETFGPAPGTY